jgi:DNA gyrase subunit B
MAKQLLSKKKMRDDKFNIIHNDVSKIKARPTMYLSSLGDAGVFHICKEIIDNNRDECLNKESPGDTIDVEITDKYIMSKDNGRGIPTGILKEVLETIQAGSKMTRAGGATSGENGVGTTCALAMSSIMIVISSRPQEKKRLKVVYKNGEFDKEECEDNYTGPSGLFTKFYPSKKIIGTDRIPIDMLRVWMKDLDFTLPSNIKMTYSILDEKFKVNHRRIDEFFAIDLPTQNCKLCNILNIACSGNLKEILSNSDDSDIVYDRSFNLEAAIVYSNPDVYKGEDIRHSWMNMIHTVDNGSHVDGVIRGFAKYLQEQVWRKNKRLDGEDLKKDILAHLNIVVKAETDMAMMFSSQAKHRVFSKELGNKIAEAVYEELSSHRYDVIDEMIDVVIGNHRARVEGEKARNVNALTKQKKQWTNPDAYIPCSSVKTEYPKEIFLVEGNSAGGGLRGARDARYQAILKFRGKNLNPWDEDLERVLKSVPWLNLVKVLGCGIGPTFDIKKLNFDKIIITTDADIDGYHIRVEFLSFFAKFMPELIYEGKVYIAEPPLYQLVRGKDISYVASQTEYLEKCIDSIGDIEIDFPGMGME